MKITSRGALVGGSYRSVAARKIVGLATSALLISSLLTAAPASAAACGANDLVPQVRGYSINQGLSSYENLVRGKDIVFRLFLSRPSCADGTTASVALTGATLNVKAGAVTLLSIPRPTNTLNPAPLLPYWKDAPAVLDSTGDPKWVIDGDALKAKAPSASLPLTFESTLSYTNSAGGSGSTLPIATHNNKPIVKTLLADTNPLRVLAIPMGDPTKVYSTQFGANAHMSTLDGFAVLGRTFPLADGTADLTQVTAGTTAGMRYHLNTNALLDVRSYMTSGLFCDTGMGLERKIAPQMETHLKQYNTANPLAKSADRVLGVIDQAISSSCAEGMALVDGQFSYVRARYKTDAATNKVVPTMTGALMGMEQGHNFGAVPCGSNPTSQSECPVDRDNIEDGFHSQNTFAHSTETSEYPDVAYNILSEQAVANDLNVMNYESQVPGSWLNANTFLQKEDWGLLICKLGGPTSPDCVLPVDGSAAAVGAVSTTTIVGTTDGTKANTEVFDSYADVDGAPDKPRNSFIHLIQKNATGQVLQDDPIQLTGDPDGHHGASGAPHSDVKVFSASYTTPEDAVELELVNIRTGEVLYERFKAGGGPRNVSTTVTMTGVSPVGCTTDCPPPSPMASAGEFGAGVETLDFDTDGDGEASTAGTAVGTEYLISKGVRFDDDARSTPKIIGDCASGDNPCRFPVGTGTRSGRFGLWNAPDTLPVGPVDPVPDSRGVPLSVSFTRPVQKVGLYIGNDDLNNATATLTAFDALNQPIEGAQVSKSSFGSASTTFIGLDSGTTNVARIELDYGNSPLGEEIDDLMFERPPGSTPTSTWRVTTTAEDDPAGEMRAAFFAKCSASNEVLASGQKPVLVEGQKATFTYDFDAKNLCRDPEDGDLTTILVRLNDGYTQTGFDAVSVEGVSDSPPMAVIDSPDAEARAHSVLQHEPITLSGQGWDANEGVLPGSNLTWLVKDQQGGIVTEGQTGNDVTLVPPSGTRWVPGTYTAKLTVRNSAGAENSTETKFQVLEDKDNDGIPVNVEGCYKGNDTDPNDAFGDYDKDGVVNQQDEDPCSARAVYEGQADFDPNTLNYPSQGGGTSVTMKVRFRYRDVVQVSGKSIRITRLGGKAVPATKAFETTGWTLGTERGVAFGVAKFDRQAIIDFLCPSPERCQTNQTVWITIAGDAPAASGKPAFSFNATDSFQVQKS